MGIPSDVLANQLGGGENSPPRENARTVVVVTAAGSGNPLLSGPPAGFTRKCLIKPSGESGVTVMNPIGGSNVQFDLLLNGNIYDRRTSDLAPDGFPQGFNLSPYLQPGDALTGSYTSGASPLHWVISYVDYPISQLVAYDIPLIVGDNLVIPAAPAGKSHVADGPGVENGAGVIIYNPGGNTPAVYTKVNSLQIDRSANTVPPGTADFLEINPGLAIDASITTALHVNADATGARAQGAYWVIDLGSN